MAKKEKMEEVKKCYPVGEENYELLEEIGRGGTGTVYRARCIPLNEIVAVKKLSLEKSELKRLADETHTMSLVDHPNVMSSYVSFTCDMFLWVVMPHMDAGSCRHILKDAFPQGIQDEAVIATVLKETLKGLHYLHCSGQVHRDIKADNIFIDRRTGVIKLGDLGCCASLYEPCDYLHCRTSFTGTPCWMAPEVIKTIPYDFECDIWSFGITAIELAQGHAPLYEYGPMEVWEKTVECPPPALQDHQNGRKFSKSFREFVKTCLVKDPNRRPSAEELLQHPFLKKAKSSVSVARSILTERESKHTGSRFMKVLGLMRHFGVRSAIHTKVAPMRTEPA